MASNMQCGIAGIRPEAIVLSLLSWLAVVASVMAADDVASQSADMKAWQQIYRLRAEALVVTVTGQEDAPLPMVPQALLSYSNPVRPDVQHGSVYLWTRDGRPQVIASIWSAYHPQNRERRSLCYEFHTLSDTKVKVPVKDGVTWEPTEASLTWQLLKNTAAPAATRPLRLAQMRGLVAGFTATGQQNEAELRLLRQPLYRYPEKSTEDVVDGAIFTFVLGTDPELFVLLEARRGKSPEEHGWYMAVARFSGTELKLQAGDVELWSSPAWTSYGRERAYDFLYGIETLNAATREPVP